MARYQTLSFTSSSVSAGSSLTIDRTGLLDFMTIHSIAVVPDTTGGTFDVKIYKADTYADAKLLAFWDNVSGSANLYDPIDDSSGSPAQALEGLSLDYEDDDATQELHIKVTNNDTSAHTYAFTIKWEPRLKKSSAGKIAAYAGSAPADGQLLIGDTSSAVFTAATLTAPAAGLSITNGAASITFALTNDLSGLEGLSSTGVAVRTGTSTWTTRTITGTSNQITVSNGDGVSGAPTLSTPQDIHTGASPTFAALTLSSPLTVANGGTNASSASITAFNNITGYTASGATGTTSTNLVFSTSPTLVTPTLGVATATRLGLGAAADASILLYASGSSPRIRLSDSAGQAPKYQLYDAVGATDKKLWSIRLGAVAAGDFAIQATNDAEDSSTTPFYITRGSGTAITSINLNAPTLHSDGSAAAPSISFINDPNTGWYAAGADSVSLALGGVAEYLFGSTRFRPISDNDTEFGDATVRWSTGYFGTRVVSGLATNAQSSFYAGANGTASMTIDSIGAASTINVRRASTSQAARSIVGSGESLLDFIAYGWDGAAYIPAAQISAEVAGAPGTNDMPGMWRFYVTADGAASVTEKFRIASPGDLSIAATAKFYFDGLGGSDTYITESGADNLQMVAGTNAYSFRTGSFGPDNDASRTNGTSSLRWSEGHYSGFVAIGTNPAASGAIRLGNNLHLSGRNAANTDNVGMIAVTTSDRVIIASGGHEIQFGVNRTAAAVPANFAANYFIKFVDGAGNAFYIPAMNANW